MATVRLKNGTEEVKPLVAATMITLNKLMSEHPLALYDLAMYCRDNSYDWFGDNDILCGRFGLVTLSPEDGDPPGARRTVAGIHQSIRNIVISATEGDGVDLSLVDPRAVAPEAKGGPDGDH